jgi:hypothetical protein
MRAKQLVTGGLALVLAATGTFAARAEQIDQENLPGATTNASSCGTSGGSIAQSFTPTLGALVALEIYALGTTGNTGVVRIHDGTVAGPVIGEATATTHDGWIRFDFASPIAVVPGQLYVVEWSNPHYWVINTTDTYPGGNAYGCTNNLIPTADAAFRTYGTTPLPVERTTWGAVKGLYRS